VGNRLTRESDGQTATRSYGDIFDELCPHYLCMGMTAEQYWDGESELKKFYRKAYMLRVENEARTADRNNWYMGQYMIHVLQCVPLLVGGLNVKSGTSLPEYPDKPFLEKLAIQKREEDRKKREEDQAKMAMALMHAAVMQFNKRFEQKQTERKALPEGAGQ